MKFFVAALGLLALGFIWTPAPDETVTLLIAGDTHGYLSPCGCTKPMSGGIRRRATAVRDIMKQGKTFLLDSGNMPGGDTRQEHLKAETLAESLREMGASAINVGLRDSVLGPGALTAINSLSGDKFISGSITPSPSFGIPAHAVLGPFLVGGASSQAEALAKNLREVAVSAGDATRNLLSGAAEAKLSAVLLLDGDEQAARQLAKEFPALALIVYSVKGDAASAPIKVGTTWIVSPGEKAKSILRITTVKGKPTKYTVIKLDPAFVDDPKIGKLEDAYLDRVKEEGLLDKLPRTTGDKFAGSKACQACHRKEYKIWENTLHYVALDTLEAVKHDWDPDCVGCHVVGLTSDTGFKSREKTPFMAGVGCENCHGPSADHAKTPKKFPLPKVDERACKSCHEPNHDPGFDFKTYWPKIKH